MVSSRRDDGAHALTYELGWRKLADPSRHASRAVRHQAGDNLKSSVAYTYRFETFADPLLPYDGFGLRCALLPSSHTCKRHASQVWLVRRPFHGGEQYPALHDCMPAWTHQTMPKCLVNVGLPVVQVYDRACRHRPRRQTVAVRQAASSGSLCVPAGRLIRLLAWCVPLYLQLQQQEPFPSTAQMQCVGPPDECETGRCLQVRRRVGCCRGVRPGRSARRPSATDSSSGASAASAGSARAASDLWTPAELRNETLQLPAQQCRYAAVNA